MKNENLHTTKDSGFKVPQNYFEGLEDSILNEVKLKSTISDSGFKAPENYFETFKVSVEKETKVISLFNKKAVLYVSSIAAAIVLFFSLTLFNNSPISIHDLDTETVDNYILDEINLEDIASLFQDNELNETQFIEYSLNDDTLDSYLEAEENNNLFLE